MRKLTVAFLAATALLSALTATPAAAKPRAANGQIVFGRDDPLVGDTVPSGCALAPRLLRRGACHRAHRSRERGEALRPRSR